MSTIVGIESVDIQKTAVLKLLDEFGVNINREDGRLQLQSTPNVPLTINNKIVRVDIGKPDRRVEYTIFNPILRVDHAQFLHELSLYSLMSEGAIEENEMYESSENITYSSQQTINSSGNEIYIVTLRDDMTNASYVYSHKEEAFAYTCVILQHLVHTRFMSQQRMDYVVHYLEQSYAEYEALSKLKTNERNQVLLDRKRQLLMPEKVNAPVIDDELDDIDVNTKRHHTYIFQYDEEKDEEMRKAKEIEDENVVFYEEDFPQNIDGTEPMEWTFDINEDDIEWIAKRYLKNVTQKSSASQKDSVSVDDTQGLSKSSRISKKAHEYIEEHTDSSNTLDVADVAIKALHHAVQKNTASPLYADDDDIQADDTAPYIETQHGNKQPPVSNAKKIMFNDDDDDMYMISHAKKQNVDKQQPVLHATVNALNDDDSSDDETQDPTQQFQNVLKNQGPYSKGQNPFYPNNVEAEYQRPIQRGISMQNINRYKDKLIMGNANTQPLQITQMKELGAPHRVNSGNMFDMPEEAELFGRKRIQPISRSPSVDFSDPWD